QGPQVPVPRRQPAAAPAYPACRRTHRRLGLAAGGISPSGVGARHPRRRSAGNQMQAQMRTRVRLVCLILGFVLALACAPAALAYTAYVSNEKGNTVTVIDTEKFEPVRTIKVGQRPRGIDLTKDGKFVLVAVGDDDTIQMIDTATGEITGTLPSGPDPEFFAQDPTGKFLYVANENDNTVTII